MECQIKVTGIDTAGAVPEVGVNVMLPVYVWGFRLPGVAGALALSSQFIAGLIDAVPIKRRLPSGRAEIAFISKDLIFA